VTNEDLFKIREVVRQELGKGEGPAAEFKEICAIEYGDSGSPLDYERDRFSYCQNTDDFSKLFEGDHAAQELQKRDVVRSEMKPNRNSPAPESQPEDQSCEEFFGSCEKRASSRSTIKLTKRLIDNEILVEGWDASGECVMTRVVAAGDEIPADAPLAKASITSSMFKTLEQLRSALTSDEIEAATKAVKSLDIDLFLQICRRAQAAA
jgi:hypothetical protein